MNKYKKILLASSFLGVIFLTPTYFLLTDREEKSYFENRNLAVLPEFDKEKLMTGELAQEYETYFVDHFPLRDEFVEAYKKYEIASPTTFVDKFHITKDNWILMKPVEVLKEKDITEAANAVIDFSKKLEEKGMDFTYISLPSKMNSISPTYPEYVIEGYSKDARDLLISELNKGVDVLNVSRFMLEKYTAEEIDAMFFKTDHHWNGVGAFNAYQIIVKELGLDNAEAVTHYEVKKPSERKFFGSWNKQLSGLVDSSSEDLSIYLPTSEESNFYDNKLYKNGVSEGTPTIWKNFYAVALEKESDETDYGKLFAGDIAKIKVVNESSKVKEKVLVLKDSFTNPMFPHLSNHFAELTLYDVRHNEPNSLMKFIDENEFDRVIVMYNNTNVEGEMYNFN